MAVRVRLLHLARWYRLTVAIGLTVICCNAAKGTKQRRVD